MKVDITSPIHNSCEAHNREIFLYINWNIRYIYSKHNLLQATTTNINFSTREWRKILLMLLELIELCPDFQ